MKKDENKLRAAFHGESKTRNMISLILVTILFLFIIVTVYLIMNPVQGEPFTEFYLLGPDGKAGNYPTNLTEGQQGRVLIGVVNHEYATTNYLLIVKKNNIIVENDSFSLDNNQKKEITFIFTSGPPDTNNLEFLLYKLPDNKTVYRSLHL
jgi:uncharacterized membrane protein